MSLETIRFDLLGLTQGQRVLDLGCGEGRHAITASLKEKLISVGIDLRHADLLTTRARFLDIVANQKDRHSLLLAVASGDQLPFPDNFFDRVICSEVLEHIPDYEKVLQEIRRVIKPHGKLAVSVPRFWTEWICWKLSRGYHEEPGGHIRIFRTGELIQAISRKGFSMTRRHWAHSLHVPFWWLKCLFWQQCKKGHEPWLVRTYHRFLVWDLMKNPLLTRFLDRILNPIMGKSVVIYFDCRSASTG